MRVPFWRVLAAFFVSPEWCWDEPVGKNDMIRSESRSDKPDAESGYDGRDNRTGRGMEYELVIDMIGLPVTLKKKATKDGKTTGGVSNEEGQENRTSKTATAKDTTEKVANGQTDEETKGKTRKRRQIDEE
jgi:hypothetical protein